MRNFKPATLYPKPQKISVFRTKNQHFSFKPIKNQRFFIIFCAHGFENYEKPFSFLTFFIETYQNALVF